MMRPTYRVAILVAITLAGSTGATASAKDSLSPVYPTTLKQTLSSDQMNSRYNAMVSKAINNPCPAPISSARGGEITVCATLNDNNAERIDLATRTLVSVDRRDTKESRNAALLDPDACDRSRAYVKASCQGGIPLIPVAAKVLGALYNVIFNK